MWAAMKVLAPFIAARKIVRLYAARLPKKQKADILCFDYDPFSR